MSRKDRGEPCACGSGMLYSACCGKFHAGAAAPTPEALMRSRYTAYARGLADYLLATWHTSTRPATLDLEAPPQPKWIGLEIAIAAQSDATHGTVRFIARYRIGGRAGRLAETSRFVREAEHWYYVDGDVA